MSIQRQIRRMLSLFGLILFAASPAAAQEVSEPEFVPYVNDVQMFDQPDLSSYGRGPSPPEGWFGSAEFVNWTQAAVPRSTVGQGGAIFVFNPGVSTTDSGTTTTASYLDSVFREVVTISGGVTTTVDFPISTFVSSYITGGSPSTTTTVGGISGGGIMQSSSLDTSFNGNTDFSGGGRYEFGRVVGGRGWFVSGFNWAASQSQDASNASVNFANPPSGFVDVRGPTGFTADGFDDDLDGDGVYGRNGRDRGTRGTLNNLPIYTGLPDGIPDPEPAGSSVGVDYDDAVPFPSKFASIHLENRTHFYNFEIMRLWQMAMGPRGGVWEMFVGPRGMNINDQFLFKATTGAAGSYDTYFDTNAQNYLLGGQLGGRWSRQRNRWQTSCEARGFAGANYQHVTQQGQIGDPATGNNGAGGAINIQVPAAFSHRVNQTIFAPGAEFRLNLKYQLFRSMYVNAGYTGMYVQNIARGAPMTYYSMPSMGLISTENKSSFFVHGINVGIVINR